MKEVKEMVVCDTKTLLFFVKGILKHKFMIDISSLEIPKNCVVN